MADTNIATESNVTPSTSRMRLGAYSAPSLSQVQGYIQEEARRELRFPNSIKLYKQMLLDNSIASAISLIEMMLGKVEWRIEVPKNATEQEKKRCDALRRNMHTMQRPWEDYINEFISYLYFGFSPVEKIYEKRNDREIGDYIGWSEFAPISQDTVGQWVFDNNTGRLVALIQDLSQISRSGFKLPANASSGNKIEVPRKKFMLFRNNPKRNNPEGQSPLKAVYASWKYKTLVEEYEVIGVSKDLGKLVS